MLKVLEDFSRFERLRGFLCHGAMTPLVDQSGTCCLGIKLLVFRGSSPCRQSLFLTKADAAGELHELIGVVSRLRAALGQLKAVIPSAA